MAVHTLHPITVEGAWDEVCAICTGKVGSCCQQLPCQLLLLLLFELVKGVSKVTV